VDAAAGHQLAVGAVGDAGDGGAVPAAVLAEDADEFLGLPVEALQGRDVRRAEGVQGRGEPGEQGGGAGGGRGAGVGQAEGEQVAADGGAVAEGVAQAGLEALQFGLRLDHGGVGRRVVPGRQESRCGGCGQQEETPERG
jgi:hypothetical protein